MHRFVLALCASLLFGCVTQGKYDDLKHLYDKAQEDLGARRQEIASLKQSIDAELAKAKELSAQIEAAEQQKAALTEQRAQQETELARLRGEETRLNDELAKLLKDRSQLKDSTERLQRALLELAQRKAEADRRVADFKALLAKFKDLIDAGTLRIQIVDGRMVLTLPTDILFDSGSAKLSKAGKQAIQQVALVLKDMPNRRFQIEGHTDNVPIHNAEYASNWELSAGRALGVVKAMTEAGMLGEALSVAGYGEFHPVATNDNDKGKKDNRRIEIVLVPDLSMLPGFDELKHVVEQH
jgi:chemotaxis protein MotB